jgi:peroxiredoxin
MKIQKNITLAVLTVLTFSISSKAQEYKNAEELKGLEVGTKAPLFEAVTQTSTAYVLAEELQNGPVIVIFYRGQWCPICNRHLSNIQDSLQYIEEKGATVIAISPEKPEYLVKMQEKTEAQFTMLYDEDYKISDAFNGTFIPSASTRMMYNKMLGAELKKSHSDESERLPIPATYVIGKDGIIKWRQFDADYKKRSSVADILISLD